MELLRSGKRKMRLKTTRKEEAQIFLVYPVLLEGHWGLAVIWSIVDPSEDVPWQDIILYLLGLWVGNISRKLYCWIWMNIRINNTNRWVLYIYITYLYVPNSYCFIFIYSEVHPCFAGFLMAFPSLLSLSYSTGFTVSFRKGFIANLCVFIQIHKS